MSTYFITAIDTDAGKSVVTGLLAKTLHNRGENIITMKMAQTGCTQYSEDIETHRKIMGMPLLPADKNGETCPYLFKFPASPHLASSMECERIDEDKIMQAVRETEMQYNTVLLEGVGGLMVPLNEETMVVDFIQQNNFPVILVTSGKLGSINHTILSLEVMKKRDINVYGVVYNHYPVTEPEITEDSAKTIKRLMKTYYPEALWAEVPYVDIDKNNAVLDLSAEWFEQGER